MPNALKRLDELDEFPGSLFLNIISRAMKSAQPFGFKEIRRISKDPCF
jgi:hypothetical protein